MKKLTYFLILALFSSCSNESTELPNGNGSISLSSQLTTVTEVTTKSTVPLTDFEGYTVYLNSQQISIPANGLIENLDPGTYSVEITNFTDFIPAFDDPRYEGTQTGVRVEANKTTPVSMVLTQANAGVFFEYDESIIGTELENVVPAVTQVETTLAFEGENKTAAGYFSPGQIVITATVDGVPIVLTGEETRTLTVGARQLWKIKLSVSSGTGGLELDINVEEITEPNQFEEWTMEKPAGTAQAPDFTKDWLITGKYYAPYENHISNLSQTVRFEVEGDRLYLKGFDVLLESLPTLTWPAPQFLVFDYDAETHEILFNHHDGQLYTVNPVIYYTTYIGTVRDAAAKELITQTRYNIYPVAHIPMVLNENATEITVGDISKLYYDPETAAGLEYDDGPVTIGWGQKTGTGDLKNMAQIENMRITMIQE